MNISSLQFFSKLNGISPVKLLLVASKTLRPLISLKVSGRLPLSWLSSRYSSSNLVQLPIELGKTPDNIFSCILQFPNSRGIKPDMLLADKMRICRYFRYPISGPNLKPLMMIGQEKSLCSFHCNQHHSMHKGLHQKRSSWILWNLVVWGFWTEQEELGHLNSYPVMLKLTRRIEKTNARKPASSCPWKFCIEVSRRSIFFSYVQVVHRTIKWGLHVWTVVIKKIAHVGNKATV